MHFFDFIVLVLVIRDIVDVWKNGSIFDERRAIVEAHDGEEVIRTWRNLPYNLLTCYGKLWQLLTCTYCLSRQVALWLTLGVCMLDLVPLWLAVVIRVIVYGFAAAQASWMLNSMLPARLQYDRIMPLPEGIPDEPGPVESGEPARPRPRSLLRRDVQPGDRFLSRIAARRARTRFRRHYSQLENPVGSAPVGDHPGAGDDQRDVAEPATGPANPPDADGPEQPHRGTTE